MKIYYLLVSNLTSFCFFEKLVHTPVKNQTANLLCLLTHSTNHKTKEKMELSVSKIDNIPPKDSLLLFLVLFEILTLVLCFLGPTLSDASLRGKFGWLRFGCFLLL